MRLGFSRRLSGKALNRLGTGKIDGGAGYIETRKRGFSAMNSYPPPPPPGPSVGQRLDEALELIEMELRHAIAYVNDAVVPQVRSESITAMRKVSEKLRNLADRMESQQRGRQGR